MRLKASQCVGIAATSLMLFTTLALGLAVEPPPPDRQRIVTLGDSITDGHTYALLVQQALSEAGKPVPLMIGAGIGGDTAAGISKRLDRDVLAFEPQVVILDDGINDMLGHPTADEYRTTMTSIIERLQAQHIDVVILTTSTVTDAHADARPKQSEFNAVVKELAASHHLTFGDLNAAMAAAGDQTKLHEPDGVHLSFAGYRVMTRVILDAMGYKEVAVPEKAVLSPPPGVLTTWRVMATSDEHPLTQQQVAKLDPQQPNFKPLELPETQPQDNWWRDQERQCGVAMSLDRLAGPGKRYISITTYPSDAAKDAVLNTGADLRAAWLNGKQIYDGTGCPAWHPGANRLPIHLEKGPNTLVVESGPAFFLSITDTRWW